MFLKVGVKSTIVPALLILLSACDSGSGGLFETPTPNETMQVQEDNDSTTDTDGGEESNNDTSDATAKFGPPQFITSECGSMEVSTKVSIVGELVSGQIVPNSITDKFHFWQVTLEPGNYHLLADASGAGDEGSEIGITIVLVGRSIPNDLTLASGSSENYDLRVYNYLEIQNTETMTIAVEPLRNRVHNYTLGIFRNGTAVPSPTFERCLPIKPLSLDTTESVVVPSKDTRAEDRWYLIDLAEGKYQLNASTSSVEREPLGYSFDIVDQFGQNERYETKTHTTEIDTLITSIDTFDRDGESPTWIRLGNVYNTGDRVPTRGFSIL